MGVLREMHPQYFTKKAEKERDEEEKKKAKIPKQPTKPNLPIQPVPPEKTINKAYHTLDMGHDNIGCDSHVSINYKKIIELRQQINVPDDQIFISVQSLTAGSEDYVDSYIDSVYFSWNETKENPHYEKQLEAYNLQLEKYNEQVSKYEEKMKQYRKDLKAYKKQYKLYELEQMKEHKVRLEAKIAKLESK